MMEYSLHCRSHIHREEEEFAWVSSLHYLE
jgi:hypothetical protein